ncbi:MAG TPA: glycoside hydrolase family 57 protein [Candidatus Paceibacterota bacterium]|nr:glycoside hydrolase family 57 protein [Candidatus Paceibacterota bacterium]
MPSVCFYFQVHQPRRVRRFRVFDIGSGGDYWGDQSGTKLDNAFIIRKVSEKCYLPANATFLELLKRHPEFRISFSFSGIFLEQLEEYAPETLESFKRLVETGQVEVLEETYYHSLAFLYSPEEFKRQVALHRQKVYDIFGVEPQVFRNTELIYNNDLAKAVEEMGYKGILAEGADHVLGWRSPNFLYRPRTTRNLSLLLKNYRLSDDIAFRFGERSWAEYPLDAGKFSQWVSAANGNGNVINLFMDYETFGEHQWEDTGIFEFLRALPSEVLKHSDNDFVTPSEAIDRYGQIAELDVPDYVSWADVERDLSAWLSNDIQHDAIQKVYDLENRVLASNDEKLIEDWRRLQTSDHFYYMCTKWFEDGDVHRYFNPYDSPYEAFIAYMNVINDLKLRLK